MILAKRCFLLTYALSTVHVPAPTKNPLSTNKWNNPRVFYQKTLNKTVKPWKTDDTPGGLSHFLRKSPYVWLLGSTFPMGMRTSDSGNSIFPIRNTWFQASLRRKGKKQTCWDEKNNYDFCCFQNTMILCYAIPVLSMCEDFWVCFLWMRWHLWSAQVRPGQYKWPKIQNSQSQPKPGQTHQIFVAVFTPCNIWLA